MKKTILAAMITCLAMPAAADVTVTFRDGAPKDRFTITSASGLCNDAPVQITIDLSSSAGKLIFDITEAGRGVEVFQPFELVAGGDIVTGASDVTDGDTGLNLEVSAIAPGAQVAFTIDVDDTIGAREITVSGSEIAGARVQVSVGSDSATGTFGDDGTARVAWPACLS